MRYNLQKKGFRKIKSYGKNKIEFTRALHDSDTHMTDYDRNGPSLWTHLTAGSHIVRFDGVGRWW